MPQMRPCYVKGTPTGTLDLRFWKRWAEKASLHPTSLCTSWLCLILFIQRWDWFNFCWQNQIEFILKYFLLILCLNICLTYLILWFYLIHIIEFLRLHVPKNTSGVTGFGTTRLGGSTSWYQRLNGKTSRAIGSPWYRDFLKGAIPSRELTYPPDGWHIWVDDFPNFPRWDMLVSWRVSLPCTSPNFSIINKHLRPPKNSTTKILNSL